MKMKQFMDADFLLDSDAARTLYFDYAERMPIIDYHCHIDPADIAADRRYETITDIWLGGDHYKWRAMRCNGVPERDITGSVQSDPFRTFSRWAETLPNLIGNPIYHWTYLELRRYFDIDEPLCPASARRIYDLCNEKLRHPDMGVRGIIRRSNVALICTTDDPADSLAHHRATAADPTFTTPVLPAFRPDKAVNIDKPGFAAYIKKLGDAAGLPIRTFDDLRQALASRVDFFETHGCKTSDHGLDTCIFLMAGEDELDSILAGALGGGEVSGQDADRYKTAVLLFLARQYYKKKWVMQIHFGALRNNSDQWFRRLGPDTGFDAVGNSRGARELSGLLNAMESSGCLPRIILYSLNPYDNEIIMSLSGCFQTDGGGCSRVQMGSAWWFNDHKTGMTKQLIDFANLGALGRFIGMTTDSRSFLSYTRHEYFRRILCNLVGSWAETGQVNESMADLGKLVQNISYHNAVQYFGF